jgi:hypothetical protein
MPKHKLTLEEEKEILKLLWTSPSVVNDKEKDYLRWYQQGFEFQSLSTVSNSIDTQGFPLGLVQGQGGPCGVLAPVQAEILCIYLFEQSSGTVEEQICHRKRLIEDQTIDEARKNRLLAQAIASLLVQTSNQTSHHSIHLVTIEGTLDNHKCEESILNDITSREDPILVQLVLENIIAFRSSMGVLMLVFSLIRTKGIDSIKEDMDDSAATLTGQFGHCSQELLNLLLTGSATSNVFDGSVPMGDTGLMLCGVQERSRIGYLTHLEALRYCQVGSFFKSPQYPIWVIGSSSHFTVLFALDQSICQESASHMMLQRLQRVFRSFDPNETGLMEVSMLGESLRQVGVPEEILSNDVSMNRLFSRLEVSGAGIVLWDEYWIVVSILLHTGSLEKALSGDFNEDDQVVEVAPPRLERSDSDIARELQAQFDAEESGVGGVSTDNSRLDNHTQDDLPRVRPKEGQKQELSYDFYHYNGLQSQATSSGGRQPRLTTFNVKTTQLKSFIGQSVPIVDSSTSGGHGSPLEEVIKTKWPSAIIKWSSHISSID